MELGKDRRTCEKVTIEWRKRLVMETSSHSPD